MALTFWDAQQTVNTTTTGDQFQPKVTQLADGSIVVVYEAYVSATDTDIMFQRYDALGSRIGVETVVNPPSTNYQLRSDITALTTGGFVVTYADFQTHQLFAQKYTAGGVANGGPIILSSSVDVISTDLFPPVAQGMANGAFVVIYPTLNFASATSGTDLVGVVVNPAGIVQPVFLASQTTVFSEFAPSVALTDSGNMLVVSARVSTDSDVGLVLLSPTGSLISGSNMAISTSIESAPSITHLSNDLFVVTWNTNIAGSIGKDIHAKIINNQGVAQGPEFKINATTLGDQFFSKVTALADGKFMVVYSTSGTPGDLHAQMFNPDGTQFGGELTISNSGAGALSTIPDVVTLADGRVAVVWPDTNSDGSGTGINMQILDPREGLFRGTANADKIYGHDGNNDDLYGMAGNDTIWGFVGNDVLHGGADDDTLYGGLDSDKLYGDAGNDNLFGEDGTDLLVGGAGADRLDGGAGTDTASYAGSLAGVTVDLSLFLSPPQVSAGDASGDILVSIENLQGSSFDDTLTGNFSTSIVNGGSGNDTLKGGSILNGDDGDDILTGSRILNGGAGIDKLNIVNGFVGAIDGGADRDLLDMSAITDGTVWVDFGYNLGPNQLFLFNFIFTVGSASVTNMESMIGTSFNDTMRGDRGSNFIDGGAGDDTILGYSPYDTLTPYASLGDVIQGGTGNDLLFSGTGNDLLDGGADDDMIEVGGGTDTVVTGTGNDTIYFSPNCGTDTVTDFSGGAGVVDVMKLYGFGTAFDTFAEVQAAASQHGADTWIVLPGTTIILQNFTATTLAADDFVLV
jgi:Ca2+-binding RTX toxin-like protein